MAKFRNFVLHEHKAIHAGLHYDLRIEKLYGGQLASWAIPKADVPGTGDKMLAVQTPDHDKKWLSMDKVEIPKGEYGAGSIKIVQKGQCEIIRWTKDIITFNVKTGSPMKGKYVLVKLKKDRTKQDNWLFLKSKNN